MIDTTAPGSAVGTTAPSEAERVVAVVVLAFSSDPAARWTFPDAQTYLAQFPAVVRAFGGRAFEHATACHVVGFAGAALWLPPGVHPDQETLSAIVEESVAPERRDDAVTLFERMGSYHPNEPHWYLPLIGVDPAHQRNGFGSALLRHTLRRCDAEHLPAYLESSSPVNIPLYERHGFVVLDTIQVGSSPPIAPMLRRAR